MNTALRPMYKCRAKAPKLPTFIYQALLGRVLITRARLLRSGVKRNFHAPFWCDVQSRMFNKIDWRVRSLLGDALFSAPA